MNNNFFSKKQFGFMKGRSTMLQLLHIIDKWTEYLEQGGQVDVIYTDFEKAFDKVPHKRLLSKLQSYNIDVEVIKWIEAFLCHRSHRVKINCKYSNWQPVISGIPQGTILGPLLFIIFINDMPEECENGTELFLFADDAKIFKYISTHQDNLMLQSSLNDLQNWSNKWLLRLNIDKCKIASYGREINFNFDYHFTNNSQEYVLERVESFKDLGVTFDSMLTFQQHCNEKTKKAYGILGLIKRNFIYLTAKTFVQLYKSMVRSQLEYANSVWLPHRQSMIKDLEKVQMRASKLVISVKKLKYQDRLISLGLPTLKYRRLRGDMIEVYKILTNKIDTDVKLDLKMAVESRTRGNKFKLANERCHYDLRKHSFSVRIVNIWNSLPNSVIEAETTNTFKNRLDKFWRNQPVLYDYKSELIGLGRRSEIFKGNYSD